MTAPRRFDQVDDLIALIGADGYLRLAEAMGGAMFHVPREPGPDHPITLAIGADAAAQVAANFHGLKITLPITEYRRRAIAALAAQQLSGDAIARRLHLPRSTVYRELARRPDTRQLALFSHD